jgi:hypothetical protein
MAILCLLPEKLSFNALGLILNHRQQPQSPSNSMNRIQFYVLTGLSSLVLLLLIGHIFLVRATTSEQNRLAQAQQVINQAQVFQGNLKQLAVRIYQDAQKSGDPGLKELLERQQIKYTPAADGTNVLESPAPPASSSNR